MVAKQLLKKWEKGDKKVTQDKWNWEKNFLKSMGHSQSSLSL